MYCKTYDYHTAEKQRWTEIDAKLAARSPDEVAADQVQAQESFQRLLERYEQYQATHRKIPNSIKYKDFLSFAEYMRRYTQQHDGKIEISAEEGGLGTIKMFFDVIIHTDIDISHSNCIFGMMFLKYRDTMISSCEDGVLVQIMAELYDVETIET